MYCSNCGNQLDDEDVFCSKCGNKVSSSSSGDQEEYFETLEFKSKFLLGGNILTPDRLIITNSEVIYKKRNRYLIGVDEVSIPFSRISSVEIDRKLIDATIIIHTYGNQTITANDFKISDAKKIKLEIEKRL